MEEHLLPIFPLNVVLFPRTDLPLHIFEEHYKQMITECLENRWEFGVVLAREEAIESAGCTASIAEVVKRYEDGKMDILTRGSRRFEILVVDKQKPYWRAAAHFFDDEGEALPESDARRAEAAALFERAAEQLLREGEETSSLLNWKDEELSFQIMARLPADTEFKQALLKMRSEAERLPQVIAYLKKLLAYLALTGKARQLAGRNGQGR